jgi:uncharacterized cupredoxin-like copper-binding protein
LKEQPIPGDKEAGGPDGGRKRTVQQVRAIGHFFRLLVIFGAASAAAAGPHPVRLNVVMVDYRFVPNHLTLQHGLPYQLHLENHGKETHEFTAPVFFAAADIDNPNVLSNDRSEVLMQPGDKKDVFLTAKKPGTYDLRCADHDWYGMVGGITVK